MTLKLKTTTRRAVFEFEGDGMTAAFELRPGDSEDELILKLRRMLAFLHREGVPARAPLMVPRDLISGGFGPDTIIRTEAPQRITSGGLDPHALRPPIGAPSGTGTLMQQGLQQAKQFTGVPPVQPIPLQESIAKAAASGWELYTKEELADG